MKDELTTPASSLEAPASRPPTSPQALPGSAVSETVYYQDKNNLVTNTCVILNSHTYAAVDIASIAMVEKPASRALGLALAITGIGYTAFSIYFYRVGLPNMGEHWELGIFFLLGMFFSGLVSWGVGVLQIIRARAMYMVVVGSSSGENNALISSNRELVETIVKAIYRAIFSQTELSEEIIYYQDKGLIVTNTRAILNSKTCVVAKIASVSLGEIPSNRMLGIIIALFGLIGIMAPIILRVVVAGIGIFWAISEKPKYTVKIVNTTGESKAFTSADKALVQKIVDSIQQAITKRGEEFNSVSTQ